MAHPNVEKYREIVSGDLDPAQLAEVVADDVVWYEAGNPTPFTGRDAVLARMSGFPATRRPPSSSTRCWATTTTSWSSAARTS